MAAPSTAIAPSTYWSTHPEACRQPFHVSPETNCSICLGSLLTDVTDVVGHVSETGTAHFSHNSCLSRWAEQCEQGRRPTTCPLGRCPLETEGINPNRVQDLTARNRSLRQRRKINRIFIDTIGVGVFTATTYYLVTSGFPFLATFLPPVCSEISRRVLPRIQYFDPGPDWNPFQNPEDIIARYLTGCFMSMYLIQPRWEKAVCVGGLEIVRLVNPPNSLKDIGQSALVGCIAGGILSSYFTYLR